MASPIDYTPIIMIRAILSTLSLQLALTAAVDAATVSIYFDAAGTQQTRSIQGNQPFDFYVVARDVPDGMLAFQICVVVPDGLTILDSEFHPRVAHSPPGQACPTPTLDSCVDVGESMWLIRFRAIYDRTPPPLDDLLCVWALPDSPFPKKGSYLNCMRQDQPLHFAQLGQSDYPDGCGVLNPTTEIEVEASVSSLSRIKALY
jgi:hypothetical protein